MPDNIPQLTDDAGNPVTLTPDEQTEFQAKLASGEITPPSAPSAPPPTIHDPYKPVIFNDDQGSPAQFTKEQAAEARRQANLVDPMHDFSEDEMVELARQSPESFNIKEAAKRPDIAQDPEALQKAANAWQKYKDSANLGDISPSKGLQGAWSFLKNGAGYIWDVIKTPGVFTGAVKQAVTGIPQVEATPTPAQKEHLRKLIEDTHATAVNLQGLFNWAEGVGGKLLSAKTSSGMVPQPIPQVEPAPQDKVENLFYDMAKDEDIARLAQEGYAPSDNEKEAVQFLNENGYPLRVDRVMERASGDPLGAFLFAKGFQLAGHAVPGIPEAAIARAGEMTATAAGKVVEVGAKAVPGVAKVVKWAAKPAGYALAATKLAVGDIPGAIGSLDIGAKAAKTFEDLGKSSVRIEQLGRQIAGKAPVTGGYSQLAKDLAQSAPAAAYELGKGVAFDVGMAATGETPEDVKNVGIGAVFGSLGGAGRVLGHTVSGQIVGARAFGKAGPRVPDNGLFPGTGLSEWHNKSYNEASRGAKDRINAVRSWLKGQDPENSEVFYLPPTPKGTPEPSVPKLVDAGTLLSPRAQALVNAGVNPAMAKAVIDGRNPAGAVTLDATTPSGARKKILAFTDVDSAPHDAMHIMENVLGESAMREIDKHIQANPLYANNWNAIGEIYANKMPGERLPGETWQDSILRRSGWGPQEAAEKLARKWLEAPVGPVSEEDFNNAFRLAVQNAPGESQAEKVYNAWHGTLTTEERNAVADRYLSREIGAENFDALFKHGMGKPDSIPAYLAHVIAAFTRAAGGEPLAGRASELGGFPLSYETIQGLREQTKPAPEAGPVAPRRAPGAGIIQRRTGEVSQTPEQLKNAGDIAAELANEAPNIPGANGGASQREILGTIAEALPGQTPIYINHFAAPGAARSAEPVNVSTRRGQRRAAIQAFRGLGQDVKNLVQRVFYPTDVLKTKGGEYQVQGWSPEALAANAQIYADWAANLAKGGKPFDLPEGLVLNSVSKTFTPDSWQKLMSSINDFAENHRNGFTGAGERLEPGAVPENIPGVFRPPEKPGASPIPVPQDMADFINYIYGFRLPETPIIRQGRTPMNVVAQRIVQAQMPERFGAAGATVLPAGTVEPKEFGTYGKTPEVQETQRKAAEALGIAGQTVQEVNPFRNRVEQTAQREGISPPSLIESIQHLNVKDIHSVEHAPEQTTLKIPANTLLAQAGFAPTREEAALPDMKREELSSDQLAAWEKSGLPFKDFFSQATRGEIGKSQVPWKPILSLGANKEFTTEQQKHTGNFDEHIAKSIPGFRETQVKTGHALVKTFGDGADMLDIAASEGSYAKTISALSGGKIKTVSLDPNPDMANFFASKSEVPGAAYDTSAFLHGFEDNGKIIPAYNPDKRFDVVHESMGFQFISPERAEQIAEAKRLMKPGGVFLTEEKVLNAQWKANEAKKDSDYKAKYFSPEDLAKKNEIVGFQQPEQESKTVGMLDNMVSNHKLEAILADNFTHVAQYWDSGNFKGYAASDDPAVLGRLLKNMGSLTTEFSTTDTPREVLGKAQAAPWRDRHALGAFDEDSGELKAALNPSGDYRGWYTSGLGGNNPWTYDATRKKVNWPQGIPEEEKQAAVSAWLKERGYPVESHSEREDVTSDTAPKGLLKSGQFAPSKKLGAIKSAAVRDPESGKIFEGPMHFFAYDKASMAGFNQRDRSFFQEGFTTTTPGEFLDREQAFERAQKLKQLSNPIDEELKNEAGFKPNDLISEDLEGQLQGAPRKETTDFLDELGRATPEEFRTKYRDYRSQKVNAGGPTAFATDAGLAARSPEDLAAFRQAREVYSKLSQDALAVKDYEAAGNYGLKSQLAREAYETATGRTYDGSSDMVETLKRLYGDKYEPSLPPEIATAQYAASTRSGKALEEEGYEVYREGVPGTGLVTYGVIGPKGQQVGAMDVVQTSPTEAGVALVNVHPDFQNKGIGETLYREAASDLQKTGVKTLSGHVVHPAPLKIREKLFGKPTALEEAGMTALGGTAYGVQSRIPEGAQFGPKTFVVRHGSTAMNNEDPNQDRIRGHKDVPLSAQGLAEAAMVANQLKDKGIQTVITSDLSRAKDTGSAIAAAADAQLVEDSGLRPWKFGPTIEGKKTSDMLPKIQELADNPDTRPPGGETFNEFRDRFIGTYHRLQDEHADENTALVTHYRNMKLLEAWRKEGTDNDRIDASHFTEHSPELGPVHYEAMDKEGNLIGAQFAARKASDTEKENNRVYLKNRNTTHGWWLNPAGKLLPLSTGEHSTDALKILGTKVPKSEQYDAYGQAALKAYQTLRNRGWVAVLPQRYFRAGNEVNTLLVRAAEEAINESQRDSLERLAIEHELVLNDHEGNSFYRPPTAPKAGEEPTPLGGVQFAPFEDKEFDKELESIRSGKSGGQTFNTDGTIWTPPAKGKVDLVSLASKNVPLGSLTRKSVLEALAPYLDLLDEPNINAGIFAFSQKGMPMVSIDVNSVVPQGFRKNTKKFAKANDQVAIWDPHIGEYGGLVQTGGKGNTRLTGLGEVTEAHNQLQAGEPVDVEDLVIRQKGLGDRTPEAELGIPVQKHSLHPSELSQMTKKQLAEHYPESVIPSVRFEPIPSEIKSSPLFKSAGSEPEAVKSFARKLVEFAREYKDNPAFESGTKWYSEFVPMLKEKFGKDAPIMAELLAGTSPNTNPSDNFAMAVDALESWKAGRFDKQIAKFQEALDRIKDETWESWIKREVKAGKVSNVPQDGPTAATFVKHWVDKFDLQPRKANGKLYGISSDAVLQILSRSWLENTPGLKTQNFVLNLLGIGHEATIDLWADRTMRRVGYSGSKERWRILPKNATGVSDPDFRFAQAAFREAANELGIEADALQGGLWFAEKHLWNKNGWGKLDLGDFRKEIEKTELLQATTRQNAAKEASRVKTARRAPAETEGFDFIQPRETK